VWQSKAGENFRYYMVFRDKELDIDGAERFERFMEIVKGL
jgi:type III restriction enzyme